MFTLAITLALTIAAAGVGYFIGWRRCRASMQDREKELANRLDVSAKSLAKAVEENKPRNHPTLSD